MGGSPDQTVAKIKNMVYMNTTNQGGNDAREKHLGEKNLLPGFAPNTKTEQNTASDERRMFLSNSFILSEQDKTGPQPTKEDARSYLPLLPNADIYLFGIGAEIYSDDLKRLRVGTGGEHFFKLKDYSNLEKVFDQIIGEEDFSCVFASGFALYSS